MHNDFNIDDEEGLGGARLAHQGAGPAPAQGTLLEGLMGSSCCSSDEGLQQVQIFLTRETVVNR